MKYCLPLLLLCGCVVVHPPTTPAPTTNAPARQALPLPPMPPKLAAKAAPFSCRFLCLDVRVSMVNREARDDRGLPAGKWEAERRYIVTLQPVAEGTNAATVWGATRDTTIKLVTTAEDFQQGKTYELGSVE